MSRWESLRSEDGEERERRYNGSRLDRNKRWTSSNSNTNFDGSRQQKYKSSLRGRQQHQRKKRIDNNQLDSSSKTGAADKNKLPILISQYDAIVNSLKSLLVRYQTREENEDHCKSLAIENLTRFFREKETVGQMSTVNEQPCNTDFFMALLDLLKVEEENTNVDDDQNLSFAVARTIEYSLRFSETRSTSNLPSKINLSKSQVEVAITTLSGRYNSTSVQPGERRSQMDTSLLIAIATLIKNHVREFPPESTARRVVGAIFIPFLSSVNQNQTQARDHAASSSTSLLEVKSVCEATVALLQNPSHASAILAPLVEDVSIQFDNVIEEQTVNPLRMKLLWVLLKFLESPLDHDDNNSRRIEEYLYACRTLSAAIDGIRNLKKGNETDNTTRNDADIQILKPLQNFILKVVTDYNNKIGKTLEAPFESLMVALLQLLRALLSCYPKAMTGTGWKLIIEGANRSVNSALGHTTSSYDLSLPVTSSYLPLSLLTIDKGYGKTTNGYEIESQTLALTMDCIADFILVLPWSKWLKHSGPGHDRQHGYNATPTKATTSGLYKTVVDASASLIGIAKFVFSKCSDKSLMKSLGRLMKSLMLEIPYCDIKLIRAGEAMSELIAKTAMGPQKYSNISWNDEKQNLACEVLVAFSGGTVTPQGLLRGMCVPARSWFLSKNESAKVFLKGLLDVFESMDGRLDQTVRILSSILRTLPDVALERWDAFHKIFKDLNPSNNIKNNTNRKDLKRLEVLESFMLGRKDFDVSTDLKPKNDRIIRDLDGIMLKQWNQNGLQRCMNIYSAFRSQDWTELDQIDGLVPCHLDNILSCCHNSSAKIREGAARAIGEFCSQYITHDISSRKSIEETKLQHRFLVSKVNAAMLGLCTDQNAGARSMSIFSLGNLANALKISNLDEILEVPRLHRMHKAILCSFNDANDKVVKNSIRSVGHTSNLLALSLRRGGNDEYFSASCGLLIETIEFLTKKLQSTLHVALNKEQKASMTWKERSAAKKHGWGACHSLGLVFEGLWIQIFDECDELASTCLKAVQCLVLCPCYHTILNEKVVLAAMAAMCHLPRKFLTISDSQDAVVGDALKISILLLESTHGTSKMATQNEKFLLYLLNSASIADATKALTDDRITTQTLGMLYSWMVQRPQIDCLSARAFEIFAVALPQPGRWSASIEFEQQFASRALQKYKQQQSEETLIQNQNSGSPARQTIEEDEADEL